MTKYKLINIKTKEEHLCERISIDGFDYYVNYPENCCIQKEGKSLMNKGCMERNNCEKFIATNNSNIDIPKVIDEVEELASEYVDSKRNVIDSYSYLDVQESFKIGYNKAKETHPNSDEDMIEFYNWMQNYQDLSCALRINEVDTAEELLQLWKEQQPKTVYYE